MQRRINLLIYLLLTAACGSEAKKFVTLPEVATPTDSAPDSNTVRPGPAGEEQITRWSSDHNRVPLGGGFIYTHINYEISTGEISISVQESDGNRIQDPRTEKIMASSSTMQKFSDALKLIKFSAIESTYDDGAPAADVEYTYLTFYTGDARKVVKCGPYDQLPSGIKFIYDATISKDFSTEEKP